MEELSKQYHRRMLSAKPRKTITNPEYDEWRRQMAADAREWPEEDLFPEDLRAARPKGR